MNVAFMSRLIHVVAVLELLSACTNLPRVQKSPQEAAEAARREDHDEKYAPLDKWGSADPAGLLPGSTVAIAQQARSAYHTRGFSLVGPSTLGSLSQLTIDPLYGWYASKLEGQQLFQGGDLRPTLMRLNTPLQPTYSKEYLRTASIVAKAELAFIAGTWAYLLARSAGLIPK